MLFGKGQIKNYDGKDPAQRRLVILLVFGGVILAMIFGLKFRQENKQEDARESLQSPGEGVPIKFEQNGEQDKTEDEAPLFPPLKSPPPIGDPSPDLAEIDWSLVDKVDTTGTISEQGLIYLFQKIRTDPSWVNESLPGPKRDTTEIWNQLQSKSGEQRGEVVYLEGALIARNRNESPLNFTELPRGNPSGLDRYFYGFLYTGEKIFMVAVWRISENPFEDGDPVRVRCRFLQNYQYEVLHQNSIKTASVPLMVADSFTRMEKNTTAGKLITPLYLFFLGFIGVFLVVLGISLWIFRRGNRRVDERIKKFRDRLRARKKNAGIGSVGEENNN